MLHFYSQSLYFIVFVSAMYVLDKNVFYFMVPSGAIEVAIISYNGFKSTYASSALPILVRFVSMCEVYPIPIFVIDNFYF